MPADATSRRAFLRAGLGAATTGLAAGTAGCVELLPPLGQRVRFGRVDVPDGDDPTYRRWIPADSSLPDDRAFDADSLLVTTPTADGSDVVGAPVGIARPIITSFVDYFGVGIEHYDLAVAVGRAVGLEGPVDPATVGETLLDSGYESASGYEGYECYERDDVPRTTAVADGRIVHAQGNHPRADVETLIDAHEGRTARRHEVDEHFDAVTSRVGSRPGLLGDSGGIYQDDPEYSLTGTDFDEDAVYWITCSRYPDGRSVPIQAIRDEIESQTIAQRSTAVDVRADGQFAVVETRLDHDVVRDDVSEAQPPQITWGVEESATAIALRHEAGESVPADRLELSANHSEPLDRQFVDEFEVATPGAELSIPAEDLGGADLAVVWHEPDSQNSSTLLQYRRS